MKRRPAAPTFAVRCRGCSATGEATVPGGIPPRWSLRTPPPPWLYDWKICPACTHARHLELVPEADPVTGRVRTPPAG